MSTAERGRAAVAGAVHRVVTRLDRAVGGAERRTIIVTLALVLALQTADSAAVGATATQLRHAFGINNTLLGLLTTVSGVIGAIATLPFGVLVDRVNRIRLLSIVVTAWAAAMAVTAAATSYPFLVVTRSLLGIVTAAAVPSIASLVGDWFAPAERGTIYGYVLSGELVGAGFGFTVSGALAAISWRLSFLILALPALVVAWLVHRLDEPPRRSSATGPGKATWPGKATASDRAARTPLTLSPAQHEVQQAGIEPDQDKVLDESPVGWSLGTAVRYVLSIPTNVTLIVAGALAYFFFAGVKAFGVEFVKHQYGIGQGVASSLTLVLGGFAIAGVILGGRLSDRWVRHGRLDARLVIGAVALLVCAGAFLPALFTDSLGIAIASLGGAAFSLAAVNPPLDAARLDIMPPPLWGRAEAIRTLVREPLEAAAPLVFGAISDYAFGGGQHGLRYTFLVMLVPLVAAAGYTLARRRRYPRDLATAVASMQRLAQPASSRQ